MVGVSVAGFAEIVIFALITVIDNFTHVKNITAVIASNIRAWAGWLEDMGEICIVDYQRLEGGSEDEHRALR